VLGHDPARGCCTNGPATYLPDPTHGQVGRGGLEPAGAWRAHGCGHHGYNRCGGAGGAGSPLAEVQLNVWEEYDRGGGHSSGNARGRAAHQEGDVA
jgi:hypothetical protein